MITNGRRVAPTERALVASRGGTGAMDLDRINSIFDAIDTNKSGDIDPSELILHLLALGQDHESISALFKAMDTDGNGSISRAEFVAGFEKMEEMTAARELEESEALYAGAEGIGSLEQVKDQISMSDLSGMPALDITRKSNSIVLGQGSDDNSCTPEEEKAMRDEMHAQMAGIEKEEKTQARLEAAKEAFDKFDTNGECNIQRDEVAKLLESLDLELTPAQLEATTDEVFAKFDADGNGSLTWGEFKKLYMKCLACDRVKKKLVEQATSQCTPEAAAAAFAAADADNSGKLDASELSSLLRKALGELSKMGDAEWDAYVADVVKRGDKDGDGQFDQEEFLNLYSHCLANKKLLDKYEQKVAKRFNVVVGRRSRPEA